MVIEDIEETKHLDVVLKLIKEKDIATIFEHFGATLHIKEGGEFAWIECGKMSYYFHKSKGKEVKHEEYETMGGKKTKKTIIPYDGWEMIV